MTRRTIKKQRNHSLEDTCSFITPIKNLQNCQPAQLFQGLFLPVDLRLNYWRQPTSSSSSKSKRNKIVMSTHSSKRNFSSSLKLNSRSFHLRNLLLLSTALTSCLLASSIALEESKPVELASTSPLSPVTAAAADAEAALSSKLNKNSETLIESESRATFQHVAAEKYSSAPVELATADVNGKSTNEPPGFNDEESSTASGSSASPIVTPSSVQVPQQVGDAGSEPQSRPQDEQQTLSAQVVEADSVRVKENELNEQQQQQPAAQQEFQFGRKAAATGSISAESGGGELAASGKAAMKSRAASLKRVASSARHSGVFGRKRNQELLNAEFVYQVTPGDEPGAQRASSRVARLEWPSTSAPSTGHSLKSAEYPDFSEILVLPNGAGQHSDSARLSQQVQQIEQVQQQVQEVPADGEVQQTESAKTTTGEELVSSTSPSTLIEQQQQQQQQQPYIRLSNVTNISGSQVNSSLSAGAQMKLMRIYVIDLDQKLVLGNGQQQQSSAEGPAGAGTGLLQQDSQFPTELKSIPYSVPEQVATSSPTVQHPSEAPASASPEPTEAPASYKQHQIPANGVPSGYEAAGQPLAYLPEGYVLLDKDTIQANQQQQQQQLVASNSSYSAPENNYKQLNTSSLIQQQQRQVTGSIGQGANASFLSSPSGGDQAYAWAAREQVASLEPALRVQQQVAYPPSSGNAAAEQQQQQQQRPQNNEQVYSYSVPQYIAPQYSKGVSSNQQQQLPGLAAPSAPGQPREQQQQQQQFAAYHNHNNYTTSTTSSHLRESELALFVQGAGTRQQDKHHASNNGSQQLAVYTPQTRNIQQLPVYQQASSASSAASQAQVQVQSIEQQQQQQDQFYSVEPAQAEASPQHQHQERPVVAGNAYAYAPATATALTTSKVATSDHWKPVDYSAPSGSGAYQAVGAQAGVAGSQPAQYANKKSNLNLNLKRPASTTSVLNGFWDHDVVKAPYSSGEAAYSGSAEFFQFGQEQEQQTRLAQQQQRPLDANHAPLKPLNYRAEQRKVRKEPQQVNQTTSYYLSGSRVNKDKRAKQQQQQVAAGPEANSNETPSQQVLVQLAELAHPSSSSSASTVADFQHLEGSTHNGTFAPRETQAGVTNELGPNQAGYAPVHSSVGQDSPLPSTAAEQPASTDGFYGTSPLAAYGFPRGTPTRSGARAKGAPQYKSQYLSVSGPPAPDGGVYEADQHEEGEQQPAQELPVPPSSQQQRKLQRLRNNYRKPAVTPYSPVEQQSSGGYPFAGGLRAANQGQQLHQYPMRQPISNYYRQQPTRTVNLLSWETLSSVASGAAKRIPSAITSILHPFNAYVGGPYKSAAYPTLNQPPHSPHYDRDVASFHRPYPLKFMSSPQKGALPSHQQQHQLPNYEPQLEEEVTGVNMSSIEISSPADLKEAAELDTEDPAPAVEERPQKSHNYSNKQSAGTGTGVIGKPVGQQKTHSELEPAQAAVLSSIEHELAHNTPANHYPKPASVRGRPARPRNPKRARNPSSVAATTTIDHTALSSASEYPAGENSASESLMFEGDLPAGAYLGGARMPQPSSSLQIGQYKITPQTQFVQSIIEPSRQMLGQYFKQYIGQISNTLG